MFHFTNSTLNFFRILFPPSEAPQNFPTSIEESVRLTTDFYGGGFAVRPEEQWFSKIRIVIGAYPSTILVDLMPTNQIVRLLLLAGQAVANPVIAQVGDFQVWNNADTTGVTLSGGLILPAGGTDMVGVATRCPVLAGGHRLKYHAVAGDIGQAIDVTAYFVAAPKGTTFFV